MMNFLTLNYLVYVSCHILKTKSKILPFVFFSLILLYRCIVHTKVFNYNICQFLQSICNHIMIWCHLLLCPPVVYFKSCEGSASIYNHPLRQYSIYLGVPRHHISLYCNQFISSPNFQSSPNLLSTENHTIYILST